MMHGASLKVSFAKLPQAMCFWLRFGLRIARKLSLKKIIIESNSKLAVDMICRGHSSNAALNFLVDEVQAFHKRD